MADIPPIRRIASAGARERFGKRNDGLRTPNRSQKEIPRTTDAPAHSLAALRGPTPGARATVGRSPPQTAPWGREATRKPREKTAATPARVSPPSREKKKTSSNPKKKKTAMTV